MSQYKQNILSLILLTKEETEYNGKLSTEHSHLCLMLAYNSSTLKQRISYARFGENVGWWKNTHLKYFGHESDCLLNY